jgi:uncharacterized protein with NRDE domain
MCTLIVLDRVLPGLPLVVASNRDEYLSRPAAPPALIPGTDDGGIPLVAPQDLEGGGTWMGVNEQGVFVGLTNQPTPTRASDRRSRGLLVRDALQKTSAEEANELVRGDAHRYNPFYLLAADGREAFLLSLGPAGPRSEVLQPGVHVVSNREPDDPTATKIPRIRRALRGLDLRSSLTRVLERLRGVLTEHAPESDPLGGVCVHAQGYGTRSSGLLALGPDRWQLWYADGPPCETKYLDYTRLLDGLRRGVRAREAN